MQLSLFTSCATDLLVVPEPTRGADYSYTDLRGADLSRASLTFANFDLSDLRGALLAGADLSGANFYRAELSGTDLSGANFSGANLRDAVLTGANLTGTNLTDVDLSHVDLCDANLEEAVVDEGPLIKRQMVPYSQEASYRGNDYLLLEAISRELVNTVRELSSCVHLQTTPQSPLEPTQVYRAPGLVDYVRFRFPGGEEKTGGRGVRGGGRQPLHRMRCAI